MEYGNFGTEKSAVGLANFLEAAILLLVFLLQVAFIWKRRDMLMPFRIKRRAGKLASARGQTCDSARGKPASVLYAV